MLGYRESSKKSPLIRGRFRGGFMQKTIFNKSSTLEKRKKLRKTQTEYEKIVWEHLKNKKLGVKFRRQHSIGEYIVDFYFSKLKLVIEIDGKTHFTNEGISYDNIRTEFFNTLGIEVIRFTNTEIIESIEVVISKFTKI